MNTTTASPAAPASCLLLYCRSGFEKECAAEIIDRAAALGSVGYVRARPDTGFVVYVAQGSESVARLWGDLRLRDLVFARQLVFALESLEGLPPGDRITPLLSAARRFGDRFSGCFLETADTNTAKELSGFLRKFEGPFRRALDQAGLLSGSAAAPRLHLFFLDSATVHVGVTDPSCTSPWPGGIPRLKFPRAAPSRSTLKLEEAFLVFLDDPDSALCPAMTAVDLGAAPGGWTFQLVRRHLRTTAVDNGNLAPELLDSGLVEHLRVDGFRYRPPKSVDWLVCDMVEQPARIAALVGDWGAAGWCRRAIFNLKLPMKKRYEEVELCRGIISARLAGTGTSWRMQFKQLYHDRAEVTGYLSRATD